MRPWLYANVRDMQSAQCAAPCCPLTVRFQRYAMMTAMTSGPQVKLLLRASLISAGCMPIVYYASQFAAAPFYPGYSFSHQVASLLGTSHSQKPWIFNLGLILTGIAAMLGTFGLYRSFRARASLWLSWLIVLCVACTGFASLKAGLFPLPDHRHGTRGFLLFTIVTPLLMLIAIWDQERLRGLRAYLLFSVLLLVPVVSLFEGKLVISGLGSGTLQRLLALATYVPIGVAGFFFFGRDPEDAQSPSRRLS